MTYDYVIGLDVGTYFHHACVLDPDGNHIISKRINQNESDIRKLYTRFHNKSPRILVIVDQPNNIGRLAVAVAQAMNIDVRYLPGLAMRQLARLHAGNSKTDVRDAYVIAHAGLKLPDSPRTVDRTDAAFRQLKVLNGIDEDLTCAYTRSINQIRAALIGTYPGFEQILRGQTIHRLWILKLLARYGGPTKLTRLGKTRTIEFARKNGARNPQPIIEALFSAIAAQTITIDSADLAEIGVMMGAQDALAKLAHRKQIEAEVLTIAQKIPHYTILLSMPSIGPKTAATILMAAGDFSDFPTAAHLASYAGIAPRTNQSGTSINSTGLNRAGNKNSKTPYGYQLSHH